MRKAKKFLIVVTVIVIAALFGGLYAIAEDREQKRNAAQSYPVRKVFKDYSPKPPAESVDTTPTLSAYEIIELLNDWYSKQAQEAGASGA